MKKILLFIIAFSITSITYGQSFFGGLIIGGNTSQIGGDNRGGYHKLGLTGGAFAGLNITDDLDVQMELKYIQKGSLSNDVENNPLYDPFLIKLDYVDLPIVFSYNLNKININDSNLKWLKLEFGISFDFLISAYQEINGWSSRKIEPWNKMVINTVIGARFNVVKNIEIGLRFIDAMSSICKTTIDPYNNGNVKYVRRVFGDYGMFNDVLQLSIFWKI